MKKIFKLACLIFSLVAAATTNAQTIRLEIEGIKNNKGQLLVGIFDSQSNFKKENTVKQFRIAKSDIKNGKHIMLIPFKIGRYGISVMDDENGNDKMNYNFLGIPQEGFGFSNYYHKGLKYPNFEKFKFALNEGETLDIKVKMRYM